MIPAAAVVPAPAGLSLLEPDDSISETIRDLCHAVLADGDSSDGDGGGARVSRE